MLVQVCGIAAVFATVVSTFDDYDELGMCRSVVSSHFEPALTQHVTERLESYGIWLEDHKQQGKRKSRNLHHTGKLEVGGCTTA